MGQKVLSPKSGEMMDDARDFDAYYITNTNITYLEYLCQVLIYTAKTGHKHRRRKKLEEQKVRSGLKRSFKAIRS